VGEEGEEEIQKSEIFGSFSKQSFGKKFGQLAKLSLSFLEF
jgi:hypothetical protein